MQCGDLVRWSINWIASRSTTGDGINYASQVGVLLEDLANGQAYKIHWSDGRTKIVHCDYFEVL